MLMSGLRLSNLNKETTYLLTYLIRTYAVIISLFFLYLMNFTFHIMLDTAGVILRVRYTSIKCDVVIFAR